MYQSHWENQTFTKTRWSRRSTTSGSRRPSPATAAWWSITRGGSYAGGHVMYYVGESDELYADELAESDLRSTTATAWLEELTGAMEATLSNTGIAAKNY